ncbi:hypothetical protein BLNAU_4805 [Blattamonas nauphoetae]|uniref:Uncharacterized protein n=1 Tax=Blattamonas nauphoetae TaxID=2049346 RepID=A0ABQ9Y921_9EUKA|nr:hypothetical protein BLNAU_4805 [Blattamonas nauphoetae]
MTTRSNKQSASKVCRNGVEWFVGQFIADFIFTLSSRAQREVWSELSMSRGSSMVPVSIGSFTSLNDQSTSNPDQARRHTEDPCFSTIIQNRIPAAFSKKAAKGSHFENGVKKEHGSGGSVEQSGYDEVITTSVETPRSEWVVRRSDNNVDFDLFEKRFGVRSITEQCENVKAGAKAYQSSQLIDRSTPCLPKASSTRVAAKEEESVTTIEGEWQERIPINGQTMR